MHCLTVVSFGLLGQLGLVDVVLPLGHLAVLLPDFFTQGRSRWTSEELQTHRRKTASKPTSQKKLITLVQEKAAFVDGKGAGEKRERESGVLPWGLSTLPPQFEDESAGPAQEIKPIPGF